MAGFFLGENRVEAEKKGRNKGCHLEGREVIHISMFDWEREVVTRDYHLSQP